MVGLFRRDLLGGAAGTLILSFTPWSQAWGAQVVDVRMWPAEEYTRLTIEHDKPMKFRYFVLRTSKPIRLAVDIEGMVLTDKLKNLIQKVKPNDPYIQAIRVGQNNPKTVRIIIDFKTDVDPQVFSLKPFGSYKYRLVFDIYPAEQKDPLMAIIQKEETEPDAISRLLAQVAEGQKRMEENREEAEAPDQIAELLAGISSGNLAPMKPDDKLVASAEKPSSKDKHGVGKKPSQAEKSTVVKSKEEQKKTQIAQTSKPSAQKSKDKRIVRASTKKRVLVIAVDPGHGGEDPGAIGRRYRTREKDVVLAISKILVRELNGVKGFRAILTRESDYFVPLGRRVAKARAAKADFFVSIHADAWVSPQASGSSIFALNTRGRVSSQNRWLARNQNNADRIGGVNLRSQNKQIQQILMDMSFSAQISDSLLYGHRILMELAKINKLHKRRVEQANFAVLKSPDIPSVLVETAFLSNPNEERQLRTTAFQKKVACAIGNGILKGFNRPGSLG